MLTELQVWSVNLYGADEGQLEKRITEKEALSKSLFCLYTLHLLSLAAQSQE